MVQLVLMGSTFVLNNTLLPVVILYTCKFHIMHNRRVAFLLVVELHLFLFLLLESSISLKPTYMGDK